MIFMKLIMPSVNGYEAAKELREIEASHKISAVDKHFICGLTSLTDERVKLESEQAGIDHIEMKPFVFEKIQHLIMMQNRKRTQWFN